MKADELDETTQAEIARARELVKQATEIVRRTKISDRALQLLRWTEFNLRRPAPVILGEDRLLDPDEMDFTRIFVTLDQACKLSRLSRTTIRKLVNDEWMPQPHRGLYGLQDLLRGVDEYFRFGGDR